MDYKIIDLEKYKRKEHFEHYNKNVPCTYSMTTKLDITNIINQKIKIYPAMLYIIAKAVNKFDEFKTDFNENKEIIVYNKINPCYTIFHKDTETFSDIWTEFDDEFETFFHSYNDDIKEFGENIKMEAKPNTPRNSFPISMIPWESFDGFNLNLKNGYDYLLPIFTMGKYYEENGKFYIPISIQVNHCVCDGFHVCKLINELKININSLNYIKH